MKKFNKLVMLLASSLLLCGCDDVEAKPSFYYKDEPILSGVASGLTANQMREIYDALVTTGSSNSEKVLNSMLLKIAENKFGTFYGTAENPGLFEVFGNAEDVTEADPAALALFLSQHSFYGEEAAKAAVMAFDYYCMARTSIQKSLFANVSNSSYQDRSTWYETKFYHSQTSQLYKIEIPAGYVFKDDVVVLGEYNYSDIQTFFGVNYLSIYKDYINRNLVPDLMRKLLVEQYLLEKNYSVLGTSNVRRVQYVGLADNANDPLATEKLIKAYAKFILEGVTADSAAKLTDQTYLDTLTPGTAVFVKDTPSATKVVINNGDGNKLADIYDTVKDLKALDVIYKGYIDGYPAEFKTWAGNIYEYVGFNGITVDLDGDTIPDLMGAEETAYGKLLKDYKKVSTDRWTTGTSTDFTNGGAYSKQMGLELKTLDIIGKTNAGDGWYRDSDLSALPSALKTRLFYIGVANEVDKLNVEDNKVDLDCNEKGKNGWYRHGNYYLVSSSFDASANLTPYCVYDESSSTWYIVRVDEAIRAPKLTQDGPNSYSKIARAAGAPTERQIALEVANLVSDTDSYKKAAKQYYVQNAAISYHDQSVYDYFKETFPDLFD